MLLQAIVNACDELCQNDKAEHARQLAEAAKHDEAVAMLSILLVGIGFFCWIITMPGAVETKAGKFWLRLIGTICIAPVIFRIFVFVALG